MNHSGIWPTQANNFVTSLNLSYISNTLMQRRTAEVSSTIQEAATISVQNALEMEIQLTGISYMLKILMLK